MVQLEIEMRILVIHGTLQVQIPIMENKVSIYLQMSVTLLKRGHMLLT